MNLKLKSESRINYKFIKTLKAKKFFNKINVDLFLNNLIPTLNHFLHLYKRNKIPYNESIFNPYTFNEDRNIKNAITIDGIKNKDTTSMTYQYFLKLNRIRIYNIVICNINFKLTFLYELSNINFELVINRFNLFCNFSKYRLEELSKKIKQFNIYFVLYNINRYVNINDNLEDQIKHGHYNCPSGYTSVYITDTTKNACMLITKIPEMMGLFTHEMGHLLGWDFEHIVDDTVFSLSGIIQKEKYDNLDIFPISNNIIKKFDFAESINNFNTTIIHSICNSIELYYSYGGNIENIFKNIIKIEILYSVYHSAKILYIAKFPNYESFFCTKSKKILLNQNALLFEYSIIRMLMFIKPCYLLDLMNKQNNIYQFTIQKNIKLFLNDYLQDIITDMDKNKYLEHIFNTCIKYIKKCSIINMEYFCIDIDLQKS